MMLIVRVWVLWCGVLTQARTRMALSPDFHCSARINRRVFSHLRDSSKLENPYWFDRVKTLVVFGVPLTWTAKDLKPLLGKAALCAL